MMREGSKTITLNPKFVKQLSCSLFDEKQKCGDTWGPGVRG
jgi:hypothetical protein